MITEQEPMRICLFIFADIITAILINSILKFSHLCIHTNLICFVIFSCLHVNDKQQLVNTYTFGGSGNTFLLLIRREQ